MAVPGERGGRPRGTLVTVLGEKSWPSVGRSSCPLTANVEDHLVVLFHLFTSSAYLVRHVLRAGIPSPQ